MTEGEIRDLMDRVHERISRYLKLGFALREITKELMYDDSLWEVVKQLPIDPDNPVDRINKAMSEAKSRKERIDVLTKELG